jgi:hypothetical protein
MAAAGRRLVDARGAARVAARLRQLPAAFRQKYVASLDSRSLARAR